MKRPAGVTVLAVLLFVNAAFYGCILAIMFLRPSIWQAVASPRLQRLIPGLHTYEGATTFFFSTVMIVACVAIGSGLWELRGWARWALLLATGIPLGRTLIGACVAFAFNPPHVVLSYVFGTAFLVWTLSNAAVVYYLIQPQVEEAFGEDVT